MSSITNVNSNTSVVNVGRTTPVTPGPQLAEKSIPVVMATDQTSIPVVEQNKVQSEVALSLLGIPRAEIALGIFADVNTYDVNPSEWSMKPAYHITGGADRQANGIKHLPTEAGALVEAGRNKTSVLTSKRFFRYQPGRVSAATFGIKSTVNLVDFCQNPPIRKFGIYDKYDGYYWENRNNGQGDNFSVVRRTQSLQYGPVSTYGIGGTGANATPLRGEDQVVGDEDTVDTTQIDDYRIVGMGADEKIYSPGLLSPDRKLLTEKRYELIDAVLDHVTSNYTQPSSTFSVELGESGDDTDITTAILSNAATSKERFYNDLVLCFNKATGWINPTSTPEGELITAEQMEARCKRDLDYWIDNFLLDLEAGGNAHTIWNTTNFTLPGSAGGNNAWESAKDRSVGVFPKISLFEAPIHYRLLQMFNGGVTGASNPVDDLSTAAKTSLTSLQTIVATAFGGATTGTASSYTDTFNIPDVHEGSGSAPTYGNKSKLDTFFDTKRNFWSYYATTKKAPVDVGTDPSTTNATPMLSSTKRYTIIDTGTAVNWTQLDANSTGLTNSDYFKGKVFVAADNIVPSSGAEMGQVCESITYDIPASGFGTSSTNVVTNAANGTGLRLFSGLTQSEIEVVLKDKCQRDVGYIIDGYKNDMIGGGDAETSYNMSMFFRGTGMSVYSQKDASGNLSEVQRHTYLKSLLTKELNAFESVNPSLNILTQKTNCLALAQRVINNFGTEDIKSITVGSRAFPGNLVVMRDGLMHTHAGVYDPSLLKDAEKIKSVITVEGSKVAGGSRLPSQFKITKGNVTFGQHIRINWSNAVDQVTVQEGASSVVVKKGEILRVRRVIGPKGNEFTCVKANDTIDFVTILNSDLSSLGEIYFETSVPFVFPKDYDILAINTSGGLGLTSEIDTTPETLNNKADDINNVSTQRVFRYINDGTSTLKTPKGAMFPYLYAFDDDLTPETDSIGENYIGFVNTALNPFGPGNTGNNIDTIRSQIDNVNFYPEYVNWIKNNVKPEYWGVYEYRVPRSRFSHDALDGQSSLAATRESYFESGTRNRVYSDIATSPVDGQVARPGQNYIESEGEKEVQGSLYNYDFTKVTMLKIEFSWYGAVGALFLAYVPVGNGEARWVRVHHLRASNQLKIASLGNATLPITYTTYGGGDEQSLGDGEDSANSGEGYDQGYQSSSHNIVKYGASYYIDGGDRGTVRLYSHNNDAIVKSRGKRFTGDVIAGGTISNSLTNGQSPKEAITGEGNTTDYINVNNDIDPRFYIGASVTTGSASDQNIKVVWSKNVSADENRLYLSKPITNTSITLLPDRAETVYGIETKKVIRSTREGNLVRNRVQVYPTKMSTANLNTGTVRLRFKKTPIFQTDVDLGSTFTLTADYPVTSENLPMPYTDGATPCLKPGESSYGWFRGRIGTEGVTVFGRLYKDTGSYYFELLESYEGELTLFNAGSFLPDLKFSANGSDLASNATVTRSSEEKEGLSSVLIISDTVVPIPGTGINVATAYLQQTGTEQFDLSPYFDYNKEYLSYPLTDIADTLYLAVDSDKTFATNEDDKNEISLGVTWEEQ